jgi:23S rRNA (pseudouridine1915-N3)-methyltransferase
MISIYAIGKRHEEWVNVGVELYEKRLKAPYNLKWVLLPHSQFDEDRARQEESERILSRLADDAFVVLLDESGATYGSPELSSLLEQQFNHSKQVSIVIGGAYGVSAELKARADVVFSLSKLVFPHQLVRLIVVEQVYRSQEIARGGNYHHV